MSPTFEHLEPRVLLSVGWDTGLLDPNLDMPAGQATELVLIDSDVQDYQEIVSDLLTEHGDLRQIDVLLLDGDRKGIEQISQILKDYKDLDAVHLISHGAAGQMSLGNTTLDYDGLIANAVWPVRDGDASTPLVIRFNYPMDAPSVKRALAIETLLPYLERDLDRALRFTVAAKLGVALGRSGRYAEALRAYEIAGQLEPGNPEVQRGLESARRLHAEAQ